MPIYAKDWFKALHSKVAANQEALKEALEKLPHWIGRVRTKIKYKIKFASPLIF